MIDNEFIKSISLNDMYTFISRCQTENKASAGTRARKIVSIRQFWKYLKNKARAIDNNVAEDLETPKIPKRIPKYLTLEESVRLLIASEYSVRNHCIITIFLNCALRLSELTSLDVGQVSADTLGVIGKGNKERKIFLTSATKKALENWLKEREHIDNTTTALFITKQGQRMTGRSVQDVERNMKIVIGATAMAIILSIANAVMLILTQDFSLPMAIFDRYSIIFAGIMIAQTIIIIVSNKKASTYEYVDELELKVA